MRKSKHIFIYTGILLALVVLVSWNAVERQTEAETAAPAPPPPAPKKIFLALLLDTSNSMDGLIEQAKSQLWNIVDELADAEHEGQKADLLIALYEYGNDGLSVRSNYIRQVTSFTSDLDSISSSLFALTTNGGSEYCGAVIRQSLTELEWGGEDEDLKMIFIAGNEPFDQGPVDFHGQCHSAQLRGIEINTIFCGGYEEGIETHWKRGAELGGGSYLNIDMDQQTVYVQTPYDARIDQLNDELNGTYVAYGSKGATKKAQQLAQDSNAESYSRSNKVKRTISKSKHVYRNEQWDLVDAMKDESFDLAAVQTEDLPEEMKSMTGYQREAYVRQKSAERTRIQKEIQSLGAKRNAYVKSYNDSIAVDNPLEEAVLKSVKEAAEAKQFSFKKPAQ